MHPYRFWHKLFGAMVVALVMAGGLLLPLSRPVAAATSPSVTAQSAAVYIVQAGDTLGAIARRYNTTVDALMAANGLTSTRIYVGQRLTIPGGPSQTTRYQVQRGDTLSSIGRRYGVTVEALMVANSLTSSRIYVGQWLVIPGVGTPIPGAAQRIRFATGATSATVTGGVQFPNRAQYVLRALAGQSMTVRVSSAVGDVNFSLQGVSDGQPYKRLENSDTAWTGSLPLTQDYLIQVATTSSAATAFTLYVEIPPLPSPAPAERIRFAPGGTSATVSNTVAQNSTYRYVLGARAGQTMLVNIASPANNGIFTILAPNGQTLGVGVRSWSGVLPGSGDYIVSVSSTGGSAGYSLAVTIR